MTHAMCIAAAACLIAVTVALHSVMALLVAGWLHVMVIVVAGGL